MGISRLLRLALPFMATGLLAGCFQPLYGEHTISATPSVRAAMAAVDVAQIPAPNGSPESRLAVNVREALLFGMGAESKPVKPHYRLNVTMISRRLSVVVDLTSARPEVENFGIDAAFTLVDLQTNRVVLTDRTFARASYDIPGLEQRFAQQRGLRDAENRTAEVIADSIKTRIASYFVSGS